MGRMKKLDEEARRQERRALLAPADGIGAVVSGLSIGEAVKRLRLLTGLTQAEFARRVAGLSTGALAQIERGEGNPTLETLDKIGRPFGLTPAFVRRGE